MAQDAAASDGALQPLALWFSFLYLDGDVSISSRSQNLAAGWRSLFLLAISFM